MITETSLLIAVAGVIFSSGALVIKVKDHTRQINGLDKRVDQHSEEVVGLVTNIVNIKDDIKEIKSDVKEILKNGKK